MDWKKALIYKNATVKEAAETIDSNSMLIAVVVSESNKLLGIVTDGDVRRAVLKGISLESTVIDIMNCSPKTVSIKENAKNLVKLFKKTGYRHFPVINESGQIIGIRLLDEIHHTVKRSNWVVLMAGGLGSRLGDLTKDCPKPSLKVGNKPLLEIILENFIEHGFVNFYISVNYKAHMIEDYFGNGTKWGANIQYLKEENKLGTAGSLSLIPQNPELPLIVMNGDLLTKVNFQSLIEFHNEHNSCGTMCVREFDIQVPYGVVEIDQHKISSINEKPIHSFFVNAGIYVLSPEALNLIPEKSYFDMPALFEGMIKNGHETTAFPIREYWIDIGQTSDLKQANGDYIRLFQ